MGLAVLLIGSFRPLHPFLGTFRSSAAMSGFESHGARVVVEVTGAVKSPGIYTFEKPPSAHHVIDKAGGLIDENTASSNEILPKALPTGSHVGVNFRKQPPRVTISPMTSAKRLVLGIPVEINKASVEDLVVIPHMSQRLAQRIIDFRDTQGPFKTHKDLICVKGIGAKNLRYFTCYLKLP